MKSGALRAVGLLVCASFMPASAAAACPDKFATFWARFKTDEAFQRQHTTARLFDSRLVDGGPIDDHRAVGKLVQRTRLKFPLVDFRAGDETRIVGGEGPRPVVRVWKPESDAYVVDFTFEKGRCWTLIRRENWSL